MTELAVVYRSVDELIPYARNARTHSDAQVAQIAASIREFGFTAPVLLDGESGIRLRRSPVLISAMMSAAVERDAFDNRWFSKRRATNRIDPLVALTMAVGQAAQGDPGSVYEERGLLVI